MRWDPENQLPIRLAWVDPDLDFRQTDGDDTVLAESDSDFGLGLAGEYQFSPRLGVEFSALSSSPDTQVRVISTVPDLSGLAVDSLSFTPLNAGINVHLTPESKVDFYVGAFLSYVLYSDLDLRLQTVNGVEVPIQDQVRIRVDDDLGWGGLLGLDIPIGERGWGISGSVRYIDTDLDTTDDDGDRQTVSYDPIIATVGFKYSF